MQIISLEHTPVTQFILCLVFLMYVAIIQQLNYSRQESKQESKKHNLQFIFLKQSQGLQTYNENGDPDRASLQSCKV